MGQPLTRQAMRSAFSLFSLSFKSFLPLFAEETQPKPKDETPRKGKTRKNIMSKNKNKNTTTETTAAPVMGTADLLKQIQDAQKLLAQLKGQKESAEAAEKQKLADMFSEMPEQFGFADWGEFYAAAKTHNNNLRDGTGPGRSRISAEVKEKVCAALRAAASPASTVDERVAGNPTTLAQKYSISAGTVNLWKKEIGLVKSRIPSAAPAA